MLNRIVLVGRLTRDPELRAANDVPVASFTIAVDNVGQKTPDGQKTATFVNCVVFRNQATNLVKFMRKGMMIGVDGRLVQRNFERKDGTKGSVLEVVCDNVSFLEPKAAGGDREIDPEITQVEPEDDSKNLEGIDIVDDDLPF